MKKNLQIQKLCNSILKLLDFGSNVNVNSPEEMKNKNKKIEIHYLRKVWFAALRLSLIFIFSGNFKATAQNTCAAPQVIAALPYTLASGTTCGTVNNYTTTIGGSTSYLSGEDRIFRFVPSTSGSITISVTQPTGAYLGMYLYTGCPFTAYIGGVQNNTATKSFTATVTAGATYFLMLDTWAAPSCTAFTNLTITAPAAAYNPCTTIPTLTCGAAATTYSMAASAGAWNTYGGTFSVPGQEKLFQFTPTVTGSYAVTMSVSTGYNDFFWKAASVGCNSTSWTYVNDIFGTGETWNVNLTAGVAYYFMMDDEDISANTGTIRVACISAAPGNDLVANAPLISCGSNTAGTTIGATLSGTYEGLTCGTAQTQPGVWYKVNGDGSTMTASLCATAWDSKINVYQGATSSSLVCVGGIDDDGPACLSSSASYSWASVSGQIYWICVSGFNSNAAFNIALTCVAPACAGSPSALASSAVSASAATISWTAGSPAPASGYQYYLSTSATAPISTTVPTGSVSAGVLSASLTGLLANTTYYFWVRSNCGASQLGWIGSGSFLTLCNSSTVSTSAFVTETMNTTSSSIGCWRLQGSGISLETAGTFPTCATQEGDRMIQFNSYNLSAGTTARLFSMPLNTIGTTGLAVDFYWLNENSPLYTMTTEGVQVQYSLDGGTTWTNSGSFFPRQDATLASGAIQWNLKTVEIGSAAVGANVLVGFLFTSQYGDNCFLDNLKIRQAKPIISSFSPTSICSGSTITINGSHFLNTTAVQFNGINAASFSIVSSTQLTAVVPSGSASGTISVTTLTGGTGTSTTSLTVNPLPIISCPSNIIVSATSGSCSAIVTYSASSSTIPLPTITYSQASGSSFNIGTTIVTATATTSGGCTTSCTFSVTVNSSGTSNWLGSISTDWFNSGNWCGGIPTSTSDVVISTGASYMPIISSAGAIAKNITINSGASLTMNGNGYLTVVGNWINNGTFVATGGDVNFNGSSSQTIAGVTTFFNLNLNNPSGLTINSNVNVNGGCQLVSGILTTGSNVLQITNGASLSYFAGYVNGYLKKYVDALNPFVIFEIGNLSGFTPANIYFNSVITDGYLTVNTISNDHPSIASSGLDSTKTINRYWNLVGSGLTFDYYSLDLEFVNSDKDLGFNEVYAGAKVFSGSSWVNTDQGSYNNNILSVENISTFGAVQIGIFNPTPLAISLSPNYGYIGLTSTVVFSGRGFISGATSVNSVAGVTINSTTINNDSTLTLNVSVSSTAIAGIRKFAITNVVNAPGLGGTSYDSLSFEIRNPPVASFFPSATTLICNVSGSIMFHNYSTGGVSYLWNFGAGASPATSTSSGSQTVSYSTTGTKIIKLLVFSPAGNDSIIKSIVVTANPPSKPASISGPLNLTCTSSIVTGVYTAPLLTDVSYNWTVPSGATITSGLGTRTIVVSFSGTFTTGVISLTESNGCGTSLARTITVTTAPLAPSLISGSTIICGLTSTTYTAAAVPGATSYTWTLPAGVTSTVGLSPITTVGASLTVNFASTFNSGSISVRANNLCTSGFARTLAISRAPAAPASISGTTLICGLSSTTYTVAATVGATSYTWILPTGITSALGASPITTAGTTLTVNISSAFSSGSISVKANNSCSSSGLRSLALKLTPNTPGTISGPSNICSLTSATYSIAAVAGSTSYTWTLPLGVTSTLGSSPITTTSTSISVLISPGVATGNITVVSNNTCGVSGVRSKVLAGCHSFVSAIADSVSQIPFEIKIYPNPAIEKFSIEFVSNINSEIVIEIYDMNGNRITVRKEIVTEGNNLLECNVSEFTKGIYLIKLVDELNQMVVTKKLVVQ